MGNGKLYQILTTIANGLASFSLGLLYVWPSYTTSLLTAKNTTILTVPMTATEESLLGSLPPLGAMIGTAIVGPLIETFGRKLGGASVYMGFVISWSLISVTKSSIVVLVARFLGGIAGGANLVHASIFISEVAEDSIRGALASAPTIFYGIGVLTSYLLGWSFEYHTIVWINLACGVICCGLLMSVPESPVFLMKKNREEEARVSLAIYRGLSRTSKLVQEEMSKIRLQISPAIEMKSVNVKEKGEEAEKEKLTAEELVIEVAKPKMSPFKTLFTSPSSRRAFIVVTTAVSIQVAMGMVPLQVYAKHVFKQADPAQADLYSVVFAVVMVAGSMVTGGVADKAGRRVLLITSSVMVALCMATLAFLLQTRLGPSWLTVVMILCYCFCFMCGAGPIPYVLLTEVFTTEVQATALMLIIEWVWFLNFLILAVFSWLNSLLGIHGTFYIFAVNSIINAVIAFFIVPETKGLSNAQIQEAFLKRRRK